MSIFLFILLLLFLIPYIGIKLLGYFLKSSVKKNFSENNSNSTYQRTSGRKKRKKIIEENEGEYIDFEEIKEN